MKINGFEFREDRFYTKKHIWIKKIENKYILGLDDILIQSIDRISDIELTYIDNDLEKEDVLATIYYKGEIMDILSPIAGTVINVNDSLEDDPDLLMEDPYEKGWLIEMENVDEENLKKFMDKDVAEDWFHREVTKD